MESFGSPGDGFWLKARCSAGSPREPAASAACRGVQGPPDFSLASACTLLLEPTPPVWPQQAAGALLECSPRGQGNWPAAKPCFMEGRTHQLPLNCIRISELLLFFVLLTKLMGSEEGWKQGREGRVVGWMECPCRHP